MGKNCKLRVPEIPTKEMGKDVFYVYVCVLRGQLFLLLNKERYAGYAFGTNNCGIKHIYIYMYVVVARTHRILYSCTSAKYVVKPVARGHNVLRSFYGLLNVR